jgi:uncharacterized membrane protein
MPSWVAVLSFASALGAGLVAGVLFAFSAFVMEALRRLRPAVGVEAMQSINELAPTPAFMLALFGTAATSLAAAVGALVADAGAATPYLLVGCALYLAGPVGMTLAYHQPRNLALGELDPQAPESAPVWTDYVRGWTRLNHLRTLAGVGATAAQIAALTTG